MKAKITVTYTFEEDVPDDHDWVNDEVSPEEAVAREFSDPWYLADLITGPFREGYDTKVSLQWM